MKSARIPLKGSPALGTLQAGWNFLKLPNLIMFVQKSQILLYLMFYPNKIFWGCHFPNANAPLQVSHPTECACSSCFLNFSRFGARFECGPLKIVSWDSKDSCSKFANTVMPVLNDWKVFYDGASKFLTMFLAVLRVFKFFGGFKTALEQQFSIKNVEEKGFRAFLAF